MIMHWGMFTEVMMELDAVEHPGPQWTTKLPIALPSTCMAT